MSSLNDYLSIVRSTTNFSFQAYAPSANFVNSSKKKLSDIALTSLSIVILLIVVAYCIYYLFAFRTDAQIRDEFGGFLVIGAIGIWRWSVLLINLVRCVFYLVVFYPRRKKKANYYFTNFIHPPLAIVMPTFKEEPSITREVVASIVAEAKTLLRPVYFAVVSTESELAAISYL